MIKTTHSQATLYTQAGLRKYLTGSERRKFLAAANACKRPELRTLCLTLAYTGCRVSEALALTGDSIERDAGCIAIKSLKKRGTKTMIRQVPVPTHLIEKLQAIHGNTSDRLWDLSRGRAWQLVKSIMLSANISAGPHATPKGLRHGFGLHAVASSIPLNLIQRWLGHASMVTTAIYLDALGEEERQIAARMWRTE